MKILAKSILDSKQIEARKSLPVDGIEILLLEKDFQNCKKTKEDLTKIAEEWPLIGLEAPDSIRKYPIDPTSTNKNIREFSENFLLRFIDFSNNVNLKTGNVAYLQFQYLFDQLIKKDYIKTTDRKAQLRKIREHYTRLKTRSSIELQIENIIPISPSSSNGTLNYCYTTIRPNDFIETQIPIALDIIHLAQTFYTWYKAKHKFKNYFSLDIKGKNPITTYIEMTEEDIEIRNRLKRKINEFGIKNAITSELIDTINNCQKIIGSLQFANAKIGYGAIQGEDGILINKGMIDIQRVFIEAIMPKNIPYVIPEYSERDYNNPINQRKSIEIIRKL